MPALPNVPQVIRVVLKHTYSTDTNVVNRFYLRYSGTIPDNTAMNTLAGNVASSWTTNIAPLCGPIVSLEQVTTTDLTSTTSAQGQNTFHHPGSRTGLAVPASAAALVNLHIQRRYRGGKPRIYFPCGTSTDMANSQNWSATFLTAMLAGYNAFIAGISAPAGMSINAQVNVSYYAGFTVHTGSTGRASNISTPRASAVVDTVTSASVDQRIASQRRRTVL